MSFSEALDRLWPHASPVVRHAVANVAMDVFQDYGVTTSLEICHIMGQISHECGGGTIIRENLNYSADRLYEIFHGPRSSANVTREECAYLAHKPQLIGERVYGIDKSPKLARMLGNKFPGDGYRFRGNGMLQLTGRGSHEHIGQITGFDLVNHPEMLEDPAISFRVAVAEFVALGALKYAQEDNGTMVTRKVNGGTNGINERVVWTNNWKREMPRVDPPSKAPRGADVDTPSLSASKIMKGAVSTAVSIGAAGGAKIAENSNVDTQKISVQDIADKVQQAQDTVTTVVGMKDSATAIIQVAKPVLGVAPNVWAIVAIVAICIAVVTVGYTIYQRYAKMRDQGV